MLTTRFTELFQVRHPIVQGGMRGVAVAELTAAVANAGCLGFLSAHTHADPEGLRREILRTRELTDRPFGVNLTVLPNIAGRDYDAYARIIVEMGIPFVETAGSNPAKFIALFKREGIRIIHKCPSSIRFALKAQELGADAVSIHGVECGGHPGEDGIPGLVLIPAAADKLKLPILSSGGVADGRGLAAVLALGADGAVMGTRFLLTRESPLHEAVKARMLAATERDTRVIGRSVSDSSRVLRNRLVDEILELERRGGTDYASLFPLIGAERWLEASRRGDAEDGAYPVGLAVGLIHDLPSVVEVVERTVADASALIRGRLAAIAAA